MDGILLFLAVCISAAPIVIGAIMCMQPERGTAPEHWWQQ